MLEHISKERRRKIRILLQYTGRSSFAIAFCCLCNESALVFNGIMMKRVITAYSVAYVINVSASLSRNKFTE